MRIFKTAKIFILVGLLFLIGSAGASVYVWNLVQDFIGVDAPVFVTEPATEVIGGVLDSAEEVLTAEVAESDAEPSALDGAGSAEASETTAPASEVPAANPIGIDASSLTEEQRATAEKFGIDVENIQISPETVACAENAVGADRLAEITAGDTPSLGEGLSLFGCFKSN